MKRLINLGRRKVDIFIAICLTSFFIFLETYLGLIIKDMTRLKLRLTIVMIGLGAAGGAIFFPLTIFLIYKEYEERKLDIVKIPPVNIRELINDDYDLFQDLN